MIAEKETTLKLETSKRSALDWAGPVAFVISLALLVAAPFLFYMLADSGSRDEAARIVALENRIVQCDNNAMLRRQLGIMETHPICLEPHATPHR